MFVGCIWDEKSLQAVLAAGGVCTLGQKNEREHFLFLGENLSAYLCPCAYLSKCSPILLQRKQHFHQKHCIE
jgi:hypothetical protein